MIRLRASLFQTIRVTTNEGHPLDLGSPTTRSLFAYLLLNRSRPSDRRRLAYLFWPRGTESAARRNLRQYLHRLRRALESVDPQGSLLVADDSAVQIDPSAQIWLDVDLFRHNSRPKASLPEMKAAVDLYYGDLLEEIYEDWCQEERRELRRIYLKLLDRLSQELQNTGLLEEAITFAQKWVSAEPLDESAYRRLLSLFALLGDRRSAANHYRILCETLAEELNTSPLPETQALFDAIQTGTFYTTYAREPTSQEPAFVAPRNIRPSVPMVGRERELRQLLDALPAARDGKGGFILITGESGIGKTRLVQEYISRCPDILPLQGVSHELEFVLPYSPLRQAFSQAVDLLPDEALQHPPAWSLTLAHILPRLAARLPFVPLEDTLAEKNSRILEALDHLTRLLVENTNKQVIHLILDDLHWGDRPTWDFLAHISRQAISSSLLILGLCRLEDLPRERIRLIRSLERNDLLLHLPLARLNFDETEHLAQSLLPREPADPLFMNRLYKETEGNPFFIIETVRAMQESGHPPALTLDRGGGRQAVGLPLSIQRVIEARLDRLSPESQELLATAAAIGRGFSFSLLKEISQAPVEEVIKQIEEWLQRGLVRETAHSYDFSHDKIRQVAYTSLSRARRQYIHRQISDVLENTVPPAEAATLAYHYARSDQPLKALPYLTKAGEQALHVRSYQEARQFGLRAVSLLGRLPGPSQRSERIDLNLQLAQAYAFTGDLVRALEILTETEHLASSLNDEERLGKIFYRSAQIFWLRGQSDVAGDYARRTLRVAEELSDPRLLQAALRMLGRVGIALSAFDDAIAYLIRYANLESTPDPPSDLPAILGYLGVAYSRVGSWKRAFESAQRALSLAKHEGSMQTIAFARMQLGFVYSDHQCWQECLDTIQGISGSVEGMNTPTGEDLAEENSSLTPVGFMVMGLRGRSLAYLGSPEEGAEVIRPALAWADQTDYRVFHYLPRIFLAESLNLCAEFAAAAEQAEHALDQARAAGNRWAAGVSMRVLAESLTRLPSPNWTRIEDYLIESMQILRQVRARPELARTYLALRRLYDRAGQIAWAVDCHFRATTIFEELEMTDELRQAQGRPARDRTGAVVNAQMQLRGPNPRGDLGLAKVPH